MVSDVFSVHPKFSDLVCNIRIRGDDRPTLAHRAQVLRRVKAETPDVSHGSDMLTVDARPDCLGAILNDGDIEWSSKLQKLQDRRRHPIEVNRDNRPR
jgi:hypothetical protein